jgi:prolyl-tRNA synthetase
MKLANMIGDRFKERPADCIIDSHALMVRGGYIKHVANGIYSQYPILKRITAKIERIIREEMDAVDGQEVLFPVVLPGSLWEESGRFTSVGRELARFSDRNGSSLVLGMTHEEAAVQLVRDYANSYSKYPFMIYQIQTKFRDEARPRAGLIRVREFTMKDAYSFHTSREDLENYYYRVYKAYERIFERAGIPEVAAVQSDSGMMGGSISHEFMLLTPAGEDSIAICRECDYKANMEAAECIVENVNRLAMGELTLVRTPGTKTIDEVGAFLNCPVENTCKAVIYQRNRDDKYVIAFTRGDLDINETKLTNLLKEDIHAAEICEGCGLIAGYTGPYKLEGDYTVIYDRSLKNIDNLVCGANIEGYHYTGFSMSRDIGDVEYADVSKIKDNGICPNCRKPAISISRGIEVGNIFQLGTKYTKAMDMRYLDKDGQLKYPVMGCYGIGVGRLAAAVCEVRHDEYGPIWPKSIAPWQVHLCCIRADDPGVRTAADALYDKLQEEGLEVIYDDRDVRPGVMFSDADLIGAPVRITVSPKNLARSCVEISSRDKSVNTMADIESSVPAARELLKKCT